MRKTQNQGDASMTEQKNDNDKLMIYTVCKKHGVMSNDEVRHLNTKYAQKYNNCLDCAIEMKGAESEKQEKTLFSQHEVADLLGCTAQNVQLIEQKAFKKLRKRSFLVPGFETVLKSILGDSTAKQDGMFSHIEIEDVSLGQSDDVYCLDADLSG